MLDRPTQHMLKQLLDTISETETILEQQRLSVCADPEFSPMTTFRRLDLQNQDRVSAYDLVQFFREHRLPSVTLGDCSRVIKTYSRNKDGLLSYDDFCSMVLPCSNSQLRTHALNRPFNRAAAQLSPSLEPQLLAIVHAEVDFSKRVQLLVKDLMRQPLFSVEAAFRSIDQYNEQFLHYKNLDEFFRYHGVALRQQEIFAIIRRISTHCDAQISIQEFSDFFGQPKAMDGPEPYQHRAKEFATKSKLDFSIEQSVKNMGMLREEDPWCKHRSVQELIKRALDRSQRMRESSSRLL